MYIRECNSPADIREFSLLAAVMVGLKYVE